METTKAMGKKVLFLILTLVMVAGLFQGLTLPVMAEIAPSMTAKINGTEFTGVSLQDAIATSGVAYSQITSIEVTDGVVTATDWDLIKSLANLVTLTVADTDAVTSVADLPAGDSNICAFPTNLVTVNIAKTKSIGNYAFSKCTKLASVSFPAVTSIGNYAFTWCSALTSASIPMAITIGDYAFGGCVALTSASFPVATSCGKHIFDGCTELTSVSLPVATSIDDYAFQDCQKLTLVSFPEALTISMYSFYRCTALTSVDFPKVTSIGQNAFNNCTALTSVSIPEATTIAVGGFCKCTALPTADFPKVTRIGNAAFKNCNILTSASFPAVTYIDDSAFLGCTALTALKLPASPPTINGTDTFKNCPATRSLVFVNASGTELTGTDMVSAQSAYKTVGDSNNETQWHGWTIYVPLPNWQDGITSTTNTWDNGGTINTAAELAQFAYNVNAGKEYSQKTITLGNDINLSGKEWTPIGRYTRDSNKAFGGTFDGMGHKITGAEIGLSAIAETTTDSVGLFGYSGGIIKNLGIDLETYINKNYVSAIGQNGDLIGSLVGYNSGTIKNCYATGNVIGGANSTIGGLVGYNSDYSRITNCYATNNVIGGDYSTIGGLVGVLSTGVIRICYATGNLTGGYNALLGGVYGSFSGHIEILNVYWNNSASMTVGGTEQTNIQGFGTSMTATAMKDAAFVTALNSYLNIIYDAELYQWKGNTDNYPTFSGTLWSAPPTTTIGKTITIATTAPVTAATITNSTSTVPTGTLAPVITWSADNGVSWTASGSFAAGTVYKTKYVYTANTGYQFDSAIAAGDISVENLGSGTKIVALSDNNKTLTITVTWPATAASATETISGIVKYNDGSPITGATVTLTPAAGTPNPATTGNDGKYTINNVPAGSYVVTVTLPNGGGSFTQNITAPGGTMDIQQPTVPTYTVSGSIKDATGSSPIPGATVTLTNTTDNTKTYTGTTDSNGNYTITGVPDGSYTVNITKGGKAYDSGNTGITVSGSNVSGGSGNITATVPTYTVSGSIKDATDSSPVSGVTVALTNTTDNTEIYIGTTNITGNYTITGVPDGSYTVNVTKGGETYDSSNSGITVSGSNVSGGSGNISATIPTYTVTYDGNGNDDGTVPSDSAPYRKEAYARVMGKGNLARNGYSFTGWNTATDGSGISYKVNDTFAIKGNVTLYAQWKAIDSAPIPIFTDSNVRGTETVTQGTIANELSVTVAVNDRGTLSYQWYEYTASTTGGAIAISSATNSSYTPSTTSAGITYYYVVVTNTPTTPSGVKPSTNKSSVKTVIVLEEPAASYPVSTNSTLNNITLDNISATQYQSYTANINADSGYYLPDRITVTMGGRTLVDGVDYIYSKTSTGAGTVTVYNVTDQIAITAAGALIPAEEYKISFKSNDLDAAVPDISGKYGDTILLPTPTKAGFSFAGWYRDSSFATSYASITMGKEDITLFAKWGPITYNISGNVKDDDNANINSALVKLMAGSRKVAQAATGSNGNFNISGVPAGTYNLVITKDDQTITLVITVLDSNLATGSVTLPKGKKNSVVEVKQNTPDIVVDKLNDFFSSDRFTPDDSNVVDAGGTVEIKLLVEKKEESGDNAAANADSIVISAKGSGKTAGIFLNLTVSKIIIPAGGAAEQPILMDELSDLLIIDIPLSAELQGKSGYVIYRYHGAAVQTITEVANADGEYIEVSADGKSIKLHTKKFSTYAVAYTTPSTPPTNNTGDGSSAGTGGNAVPSTITAEPCEGGRIDIGTDNKTATITPDNGYAIADVIVDGKSIGLTEKYTFTDGAAHKISAVFVKKTALPYYNQDGEKVYIGFSAMEENLYKYIAPANVTVKFMDNPKNFIDNTIAWAKPSIDFVTERELFLGTSQSIFSPNDNMTRAMFVAVIGRLYERSYGSVSGTNTFSDVDTKDYYAKYVAWANENGIIKGVGDNKFDPNANVTREQMAVIMSNFAKLLNKAGVTENPLAYTDSASISSWAIEGAKYCQNTKVIEGRTGGIFAPQESATRAEASAILQRFIKNMLK